jgi:uncharacterized protein YndB with AHSA1/START domain
MKPFDFITNMQAHTLTMRRAFQAQRELVWNCYTKHELLEQWFAPKPMTTRTKSFDFSEGGHWHYVMVEPNGTEYWGWTNYLKIKPVEQYVANDAFCNEAGEINEELPGAEWAVSFLDKGEETVVESVLTFKTPEDLEAVVKMGMEEGMVATWAALDEVLMTLKK